MYISEAESFKEILPHNFESLMDSHSSIQSSTKCKVYVFINIGIFWFPTDFTSFSSTMHTSGVGTATYASPEQLDGSDYDSKVGSCTMRSIGSKKLETAI